jgi:hypothetical protein
MCADALQDANRHHVLGFGQRHAHLHRAFVPAVVVVRLGQAWVRADSPFSIFPGYQRWLVVVAGEGLILNQRHLAPLTPLQFSGEEQIACQKLGAEVVDLGLIYNPEVVSAEMKLVEGEVRWNAGLAYLYDLKSGDTLRLVGPHTQNIPKSVLITLSPVADSKLFETIQAHRES